MIEPTVIFAEGAEKSVLSSCMKDPGLFRRAVGEGLRAEHFHDASRRIVFSELRARLNAEGPLDLVELCQSMADAGLLEAVGGPAALSEIYGHAVTNLYFDNHLRIVREKLAHRTVSAACLEVLEEGSGWNVHQAIERVRMAMEEAVSEAAPSSPFKDGRQLAQELAAEIVVMGEGEMPGLATGIDALDVQTGGMRAGELWVVGAPTSGGKTVLLLQAALRTLQAGKRVVIVSLEMTGKEIAARIIANRDSVPLSTFRIPLKAKKNDLGHVKIGIDALGEYGRLLLVDDRGGRRVDEIEGMLQSEIDRNGPVELLVVDYLQLVEASPIKGRARYQEIAEVTRKLKSLAKRHGLPVMTASQLNDDGLLMESRAIGHDADAVLMLENEGWSAKKLRNGERGKLYQVKLNGEMQRFEAIRS